MPFRLVNDSAALLAIQQRGCPHWDLLGARESMGYAPDSTRLPAVLRIHGTDASAAWQADAERALEGDDKADRDVPFEPRGGGVPGAAARGEALLMGAPCERAGPNNQLCKGWLLLTAAAVSFLPFEPPADDETGGASANGAALALQPVPARSLSGCAAGAGAMRLTFQGAEGLDLSCVRDRDAVLARLHAARDAAAAIADAAAVASKLPPPPPPPPLELVTVHDFWNAELKQLTFHPGDGWLLAGGAHEERKGPQFVALARAAPGAVPVYDWWSNKLKKLSLHPEPAWEGETRRGL
eukprot:scaffold924_cov99-Isochrysis_galbana.AAC.1